MIRKTNSVLIVLSVLGATLFGSLSFGETAVPSMSYYREGGRFTVLKDGDFLIAGGQDNFPVERYHFGTALWEVIQPPRPISLFTALVKLSDGGVFFQSTSMDDNKTSIIFDPVHSAWTSAAKPTVDRFVFGTALLHDGRVITVGGCTDTSCSDDSKSLTPVAEIYDPATDRWTRVAPMHHLRSDPSMEVLADGNVFVIGGNESNIPELYDVKKNKWSDLPRFKLDYSRASRFLPDGRVIVFGDAWGSNHPVPTELYSPFTGKSKILPATQFRTEYASSVVIGKDTVLIAGGSYVKDDTGYYSNTVELYNYETGVSKPLKPMKYGRVNFPVFAKSSKEVLFFGGFIQNEDFKRCRECERYVENYTISP